MDASVLAICGMGGIGKTTIAKFVYNLNKGKFDSSSFLANIRERSQEPNGLVKLQRQLLSDFGKEQKISCVDEGIIKIKEVIYCKRGLLILDDVDQVDQLNIVFGMRRWFSPQSKIIVTTRDESLLNHHEIHKVDKVEHFDSKESLELFSWHAFGQDHPIEDYLKQSERVVHHCEGLPLALKVLGSSLSGKNVNVWESALQKLEAIPNSQILRKLEISYDSLQDDHDKNLFLHIACFFVGWDRGWTTKILDGCDFYTIVGIQNLFDRYLLSVDGLNKLTMHQLLRDMGREIARQELLKVPGKHSRLWHHRDSFKVLREKTGINNVQGLILDMHMFKEEKGTKTQFGVNNAKKRKHEEILDKSFTSDLRSSLKRHFFSRFSWHLVDTTSKSLNMVEFVQTDAFAEMYKLRLHQLNHVQITGSFNKFPRRLRWLCWHGFPLKSMPIEFPLESLIALDMRCSSLKQIWKGTRFLNRLKILDLSHFHGLIETPNFLGLPKLEILILEDCVSLVDFHESIVKLETLVVLDLKDCKNLKKLPRNICMLQFLEMLVISGCSNLDLLPSEFRTMSSLKVLHADRIFLNQALSTTKEVRSWHAIIWSWVSRTKRSPESSLVSLPCSLVRLSLVGCNLSDEAFPMDFSNLSLLKDLDLSKTLIGSLPESIRSLNELRMIKVNSCRSLKSIKGTPSVRFNVRDIPYMRTPYQLAFPRHLAWHVCIVTIWLRLRASSS